MLTYSAVTYPWPVYIGFMLYGRRMPLVYHTACQLATCWSMSRSVCVAFLSAESAMHVVSHSASIYIAFLSTERDAQIGPLVQQAGDSRNVTSRPVIQSQQM